MCIRDRYNTTRNHLVMREYGRHIQRMIEYLLTIEDRDERERNAQSVIELMGFLNPQSEVLPYPKRYPKHSHLGKNLELIIQKALQEENADKKNCLSNAIAYYMKLAYANWHKETVHDDAIQGEL